MIITIPQGVAFSGPELPVQTEPVDLEAYIEHKIGASLQEIEADSRERFLVIETEALRDLIVMSEVSGSDCAIILGAHTLDNPECARLVREETTFLI